MWLDEKGLRSGYKDACVCLSTIEASFHGWTLRQTWLAEWVNQLECLLLSCLICIKCTGISGTSNLAPIIPNYCWFYTVDIIMDLKHCFCLYRSKHIKSSIYDGHEQTKIYSEYYQDLASYITKGQSCRVIKISRIWSRQPSRNNANYNVKSWLEHCQVEKSVCALPKLPCNWLEFDQDSRRSGPLPC